MNKPQTIFMYGIGIYEPILFEMWMRECPENFTREEWWNIFLEDMADDEAICLNPNEDYGSRFWIVGKQLPTTIEIDKIEPYKVATDTMLSLNFISTNMHVMIEEKWVTKPRLWVR